MVPKVYRKTTKFGEFSSSYYPKKQKNNLITMAVISFVFASIGLFVIKPISQIRDPELPILCVLLYMALWVCIGYFSGIKQVKKLDEEYAAFLREVNELKAKEAEEQAYRKNNEDELFYQECAKHGIHPHNAAGVARMKLIAKQMDISCSDDELKQKYLKGQTAAEARAKLTAEREKQARIPLLRKEEQAKEREFRKYIRLTGSDKRIAMLTDEANRFRAMAQRCEEAADSIATGTDALYSMYAGKETDWAVHGGVASAIAGGAAGVAVAADIQRQNAEVRAANAQLRDSLGRFSAEQQLEMSMQRRKYEERVAYFEKKAEQAKLKLVETLPQEELLALLAPEIKETQISETGSITFTVCTAKTSLNIYETVNAVVDGSFKVKILDGAKLCGEAYFTLPLNGAKDENTLSSICASLPETKTDYTFEFAPHNLFAIEL